MSELILQRNKANVILRYVRYGIGAIFTIITCQLFYDKTYLFWFHNRTYNNKKLIYKWLSEGNVPTKCEYFELFPS